MPLFAHASFLEVGCAAASATSLTLRRAAKHKADTNEDQEPTAHANLAPKKKPAPKCVHFVTMKSIKRIFELINIMGKCTRLRVTSHIGSITCAFRPSSTQKAPKQAVVEAADNAATADTAGAIAIVMRRVPRLSLTHSRRSSQAPTKHQVDHCNWM